MSKAYTLIELIIVISILMILTGLSVLNLNSLGASADIDAAKTVVVTSLWQARDNSLNLVDDHAWGVHLESDKIIIFADTGSGYEPQNSANIVKPISNVDLSWQLAGGTNLIFPKGTGKVSAENKITLKKNLATREITINAQGVINY